MNYKHIFFFLLIISVISCTNSEEDESKETKNEMVELIKYLNQLSQEDRAFERAIYQQDGLSQEIKAYDKSIEFEEEQLFIYYDTGVLTDEQVQDFRNLVIKGYYDIIDFLYGGTLPPDVRSHTIHLTIKNEYSRFNLQQSGEIILYATGILEQSAPYLHELVHALTKRTHAETKWLDEGLATYVDNKLSAYRVNDGVSSTIPKSLKYRAKYFWEQGEEYRSFIKKSLYSLDEADIVKNYFSVMYITQASLIEYIVGEVGIEVFMDIYDDPDFEETFVTKTGVSLEEWFERWVEYIEDV